MSIETSSDSSSTVSARKLRANRRNAQKSTGPKTEEGKKASSRNSLVHGLYCAKDFILPGESEAQFLFLRQNHIRSLLPMSSIELSLVERVARNEWKIKRVQQLQRQWHFLQMRREQLQAEVMATKVVHPANLITEEESFAMTQFEEDYLERLLGARGGDPEFRKPRQAREKLLAESIAQGMVTQEHIRSVQFAGDERSLDRFERLEKTELRYENAMDKALRELARLQSARRKRLGPDEIEDDELTCPYLEDYQEIQTVLEEEQAEQKTFVQGLGDADDEDSIEDEANEATEPPADDKSNEEKDLATDGARINMDETEENETPNRDMGFDPVQEGLESAEDVNLDDPGTA